jgi:hypothetical protein
MFRVVLYAVELLAVLLAARWLLARMRGAFSAPAENPALEQGSRWETHTESGGGQTSVVVRRVATTGAELGRQLVATIPDSAPDWELRYHEAMAEARSRLAALKSQSS